VASEGERQEEEMWRESVARYNSRERRQNQAAWYSWHCQQAERHKRTLATLIARHEAEAAKLLEDEPSEATEGEA
jgi:hypothetical protein